MAPSGQAKSSCQCHQVASSPAQTACAHQARRALTQDLSQAAVTLEPDLYLPHPGPTSGPPGPAPRWLSPTDLSLLRPLPSVHLPFLTDVSPFPKEIGAIRHTYPQLPPVFPSPQRMSPVSLISASQKAVFFFHIYPRNEGTSLLLFLSQNPEEKSRPGPSPCLTHLPLTPQLEVRPQPALRLPGPRHRLTARPQMPRGMASSWRHVAL